MAIYVKVTEADVVKAIKTLVPWVKLCNGQCLQYLLHSLQQYKPRLPPGGCGKVTWSRFHVAYDIEIIISSYYFKPGLA